MPDHKEKIREQDPLKQGLKQNYHAWRDNSDYIREQDPLKQGLKPSVIADRSGAWPDSRARSTKTRIETVCKNMCSRINIHSRARSTKTRIET